MTRTFHGYPIPDDAHPTRPWWTPIGSASMGAYFPTRWVRSDGTRGPIVEGDPLYDREPMRGEPLADVLARVDREHPLPAPPPMCGQVWRWPDGSESMIIARRADGHYLVHRGLALASTYHSPGHWPPPGAVLVAGPGSPWAPPEYEPEEVTP